MIKAGDLRIGNLYEVDQSIMKVTSISEHGFGGATIIPAKGMHTNSGQHSGVLLSHDWLLRAGFKQNILIASREYLFNDLLMVDHYENGFLFKMAWWKTGTFLTDVHQLQNLYYALTGNELEIKEPQPA